MKVGDLVTLGALEEQGGVGIIIEASVADPLPLNDASFFRVAWGKDPHAGQLTIEDWVYFEEDLMIIRTENG
jgi:hypothetical protein